MWIENGIVRDDLDYISSVSFINWDIFRNSTFLITGGTGLIGSTIVNALVYANQKYDLRLTINLIVRDADKSHKMFVEQEKICSINYIIGNVESISEIPECVDYIIHGASPTSSRYFLENAVETISTSVLGTMALLRIAKENKIKGLIYLSSMEIYGTPQYDTTIDEAHLAILDLSNPRSSYPVSKCLSESLCVAYAHEYKLPIIIARLTQTFGPGVKYNDQRVFAEFARCAIEDKDIILATKGETARNYLYTADAVTALLLLLQKGMTGNSYNIANAETYCTIKQMADFVAMNFGHGIGVKIDESKCFNRGFAPVLHMNLDTRKLQSLGWNAAYSLRDMYSRLISTMKNQNS